MALASGDASETIKLLSCDGELFTVAVSEAKVSRTLATVLEELGHHSDDVIPLPNVNALILKKVLTWTKHHLEVSSEGSQPPPASPVTLPPPHTPPPPSQVPPLQPRPQPRPYQRPVHRVPAPQGTDLSQWDKDFLARNKDDVYHLLLAANYLDIKGLMDILCKAVADIIRGKDPDQIRTTFNASDPTNPETLPTPHPLPHPTQPHPVTNSESDSPPAGETQARPYKETTV